MQFSTPYKLHLYLPTPTRTSQSHLYPPPVRKNFFVFKRFSCFSTTASNLGHTEATFLRWIWLVDFLIWCASSFVSPFSVRLQGSEFRRRMAHELHPGSVRGSVHMHGVSNCVMHGQTVCAQQPNVQELAERNKINMNLLLTKRFFLDNRVPIFQCFSFFHLFFFIPKFVKFMHAWTLVISYLL